MGHLKNLTRNTTIATEVQIAQTLWTRTRGLLGTKSLAPGTTLWIHRCNSVHTFFMAYAIDTVFVDQSLRVRALHSNVKPWSLLAPTWSASSVFELPAGTLKSVHVELGDQLYVDP